MSDCAEKKRLMAEVVEAREACLIAIKFLQDAADEQIDARHAKAEECLESYKGAREQLERHVREHQC
jgi:hypothetical protein